jgi:ribosomal protein S24E
VFFKRKEEKILVKHSGSSTPAKNELIKTLAANNSVDESQIVIDHILTKKGSAESVVKIKILKEKPAVKKEVEKVETQVSQDAPVAEKSG